MADQRTLELLRTLGVKPAADIAPVNPFIEPYTGPRNTARWAEGRGVPLSAAPAPATTNGAPASYGINIVRLLEGLGFGPKSAGAAQAPGGGQSVSVQATPPALPVTVRPQPPVPADGSLPNPFNVPYTGLKNEMYPSTAEGDLAQPTMAPPRGLLAPPKPAAVASAPAAPQGADAAYVPMPPRQTKDDYGPAWNTPAPPPQYSHLNPTPSLDEIFRREYAANPNGFTPGRLFGLFG